MWHRRGREQDGRNTKFSILHWWNTHTSISAIFYNLGFYEESIDGSLCVSCLFIRLMSLRNRYTSRTNTLHTTTRIDIERKAKNR